jgi:hypothetical protein
MVVGEVRSRLHGFIRGLQSLGEITDTEKKIVIPGGASFTPRELVDLDRCLGYFPEKLDLGAIAALQGAVARVLYLTGAPMDPAYAGAEAVTTIPALLEDDEGDAA